MRKIFYSLSLVVLSLSVFAQVWNDDINGLDSLALNPYGSGQVYDLLNFNDSILYIGGAFYTVNNQLAKSFASWNTDTVTTYQQGVEIGGVYTITTYHDTLYIGGSFTSASENPNTAYLAVWNGSNWQSISIGQPGGEVRDFCIFHDTLFITGNFNTIGGIDYNKIAAYNGEEWINVGGLGHWSKALAVFNDELYAGGFWGVKRYLGGDEWELFDIVPNGYVNELTVDTINSFLFVGGQFFAIGEEDSWGSAIWDGFSWVSMGTSVAGTTVYSQASAMYRGEYYVGNGIHMIDNNDNYEFFIKKWNGVAWDSIGGAFSSTISALEVFRDTLYIGGHFTYWGGNSPVPDKRNKGLVKLYMPENGCDYLKPRINTWADTVYLEGGEAELNFYNNNPYANSWEWDFTSTGSVTIPGSSERNPVVTFTEPGEYDVQVIVTQDGCVKTAEKTVWVLLSDDIENFSSPGQIKMQVFPNPSSNGFTVKTSLSDYQKAEIKIAGLNGHLKDIIPVTNETTLISTKGWKPGTYVCNLFVDWRFVKAEKLVFE